MVYSKESSKWKAYQFSDPFATNSFLVCNKLTKTFCRPDCDHVPKTDLKNDIKYVDFYEDAIKLRFKPCKHCDPINKPLIDVELLVKCVNTINSEIGFMNPLTEEDEEYNNEKIKENILELKISNKEHIMKVLDKSEIGARRQLVPVVGHTLSRDLLLSVNLSKNDSDHYRLVDLACRHLAHAAAINLFFPKKYVDEESSLGKKKRRRGGVLGFKELAAKLKLSAWHFHRVFKSVTGLTPKTYGDKCNEFLEKYKDSDYINYSEFNQSITPVSKDSSLDNSPMEEHRAKRQRTDNYDYVYGFDRSNSFPNLYQYEEPLDMMFDPMTQQMPQYQVPVLAQFQFQPQQPQQPQMPLQLPIQPQQPLFADQYPFSTPGSANSMSSASSATGSNFSMNNISPVSLDLEDVQVPSIFKKDYKIDIPEMPVGLDNANGAPSVPMDFLNDYNFDDNDLHDFLTSV